MGDRIGLLMKDKYGDISDIIIHSHWMGRELITLAQKYLKQRQQVVKDEMCDRLVYDFVWWLGVSQIETDIDLRTDDDDCEDHGTWILDVAEGVIG